MVESKTTIGGIFLSENCRYIIRYENEIYELGENSLNLNKILKQLGFIHKQLRAFIHKENRNQRSENKSLQSDNSKTTKAFNAPPAFIGKPKKTNFYKIH